MRSDFAWHLSLLNVEGLKRLFELEVDYLCIFEGSRGQALGYGAWDLRCKVWVSRLTSDSFSFGVLNSKFRDSGFESSVHGR